MLCYVYVELLCYCTDPVPFLLLDAGVDIWELRPYLHSEIRADISFHFAEIQVPYRSCQSEAWHHR